MNTPTPDHPQHDPMPPVDAARAFLIQAAECSQHKQDGEALALNRQALKIAMNGFQQEGSGQCLHLALCAYRGIAVSAYLTGRPQEGATAIATGLSHAALGLKHWPDATPLHEEQQYLLSLQSKTGSNGSVYISDDLSSWPFDD